MLLLSRLASAQLGAETQDAILVILAIGLVVILERNRLSPNGLP